MRPVEVLQVRLFGRSVLSTLFRTPVLILHTTGRRSGEERSTTLAFTVDGDDVIVVGGAGGQARVPDWVANLRDDPSAAVTIDRVRLEVTAAEITGAERDGMWDELSAVWPRIVVYEKRAGRPIPVFRFSFV